MNTYIYGQVSAVRENTFLFSFRKKKYIPYIYICIYTFLIKNNNVLSKFEHTNCVMGNDICQHVLNFRTFSNKVNCLISNLFILFGPIVPNLVSPSHLNWYIS